MPLNKSLFVKPLKNLAKTKFKIYAEHFGLFFVDAVGVSDTFSPARPQAFLDTVGVNDTQSSSLGVSGGQGWQVQERRCPPLQQERRCPMFIQPLIRQDIKPNAAPLMHSPHRDTE